MQERTRKIRSDKKKEIRPYLASVHRMWIHRIARYLQSPEGEVGVSLVETALGHASCLEHFQDYYKRPYQYGNLTLFPKPNRKEIESYLVVKGERDRYKMKFTQPTVMKIEDFQLALGTSFLAHATHALLKYALYEDDIIERVAPGFNATEMRVPPLLKAKVKSFSTDKSNPWNIVK
ncbi:hypothetical protein ACFYKX_10265 [Cytobacillus sp. FJAT-54145]|uniref:Uncharacterized protein n=1 Tax=Cytobacillus spartinae TaxID=3299023 RepID=A0ABW6K9W2_9BACI